ncbi:PhzF family phenazine biosynthesis protein [Aureibacter tunicatorum]|uniref:PhzF family phenazine biosynthesis protein n=1 Tax=Aureibacter tunicatorum TaxID=866807 RepID=A0AAE4BUI1_9BACT|nr:PhzF family phenazine biosynthesis protein [Aureibacter tunicatorum]MDR6241090.1 PhzF family phenazine biosynthesis protein [Aureibacter tunicatorum]BDD03868.1 putative isomerase [Aureibacter tunicatorum]
MKKLETYIVDSFTDQPFKGNPAGVCLLKDELADSEMLLIAKELGLSETAFIGELNENNEYPIRYFSPVMEIPLCGHATLASSKVLFEKFGQDSITFVNIQNLKLPIELEEGFIKMRFPIYETVPDEAPMELLKALGIEKANNSAYNAETHILLLEIESAEVLKNLAPDFDKLKKSHNGINGVLVTALSSKPGFDFESRYFWPWSGTNEDPATGGTHTFLAKYWGEKLNKSRMNSFQCSERTGFMEVELLDKEKMVIKSKAQIVLKGELEI